MLVIRNFDQFPRFHGHEDNAYEFCNNFERYLNIGGIVVTDENILKLFPLLLHGRSRQWFEALPRATSATWNLLKQAFLKQYSSLPNILTIRDKLCKFRQEPNEDYEKAYYRYWNLITQNPNHGLTETDQLVYFLNGLRHE